MILCYTRLFVFAVVARAVHSLAKVGDEIFIQPGEDELLFRTINSAKSAFAEFRMCRSFFSSFSFPTPQNDTECKITMKVLDTFFFFF